MFTENTLLWLEKLFYERFGSDFRIKEIEGSVVIELLERPGQLVFDQLDPVFHKSRSDFPCQYWNAESEGYTAPIEAQLPAPGTQQLSSPLISYSEKEAKVHYDIVGLTYWMLARMEEIGREDLDKHQRFPATSSHAYKHGYLERPIVDEWLDILGQVIQRVWPQIELKKHSFEVKVSHDVDGPTRYAFQSPGRLIRTIGGDVLVRRISSLYLWALGMAE